MRADPILGAIIKRKGVCGLAERGAEPRLRSLMRALVSQQLSVKAAETIFSRLLALFPGDDACPTPEAILQVPLEALRGVGLSRQKASYLHDLSARVVAGTLRLDELDELSDEQVMAALTAVKGVGRWTAEMILIFQLGRPDVLPGGRRGRAQVDSECLRPAPAPVGEAGAADRRALATVPLDRLVVPVGGARQSVDGLGLEGQGSAA